MARLGPGTARTACSVGRTAAGSACRLKTPGSVDTGGPNERCGRNDAKRRPCGRLREVRPEPGLARMPVTARPALRVRIGANRVVTGAKIGLRASGGKGIAKKIVREALVTAW